MKTLIKNIARKSRKFLALSVVVGSFALASLANAQNIQYLLNNGVVPIGLSNRVTFTAVEGSKVAIHIASLQLTGAGTAGVSVILEGSNDNANWSPTPHQFFRSASGATAINHLTNFDVGPYTFLRATIHNTNSVAVTNSTITAICKKEYR